MVAALSGCGGEEPAGPSTSTPASADLTVVPAQLTWVLFNNTGVPVSSAGPTDHTGDAVSGYTQSPQGAAMAAINGLVRMGVATDDQIDAIAQMVAPGVGRDRWLVARKLQSVQDAPAAADVPVVLGYLITHYSLTDTSMQIVTRQPDRSLTSTQGRVVWRDHDWKVALPDDVSAPSAVTALDAVPPAMVHLR